MRSSWGDERPARAGHSISGGVCPAQAKSVAYDKHARHRHGGGGEDRGQQGSVHGVEHTGCDRDQHDIVGKCPKQVLLDVAYRRLAQGNRFGLTVASITPATPFRAFSTRRTQDAQDIPSISNEVDSGFAIARSIFDGAVTGRSSLSCIYT